MDLISILLGGMAAGMVLFIVSVGLSVTMGLMGFVNLAHGGFAMLGGYAIVLSMTHWGLPFFAALAFGFVAVAAIAVVLERLLYARLYGASELDQVLFTIGLVFAMIATVTLGVGPETQTVVLPEWLRGQTDLGFIQYRTYSLALIVAGSALMIALWLGFERTRVGARIRAAVDNRRMAQSMGVNVGPPVHAHLRAGQRPGRRGRRPGRGNPRPRPAVSVPLPRLLPDRGRGGGHGQGRGRVRRGDPDRRARFRAEDLLPQGRHDVHLRA